MFIEVVHAATEAVGDAEAATGPIGTLGINLKLFIAQLINFAVILFVLWRWAYRPLLRIMHERQKTIADGLDNAKKIETRLGETEQEYRTKINAAKKEAIAIIEQGKKDAEARAVVMKKKAEEDMQTLLASARTQINAEKDASMRAVRESAAALITETVRRVVLEKMSTKENEEFIRSVLKKEV
ncbi:ATP synthase F0 subunit B [Candidatus Uhrbacteria bacterium RIFCSPLOWO2_02_FULL_51_9]|uniref:ATP synthase subunit b n=1 Tax=Candidatus Uhrbacteria bacterium RIFCSPLOWO2_02_FULL_51_9 TaxID=1802410 RepID=A0A1F7VFN7_9BACT|nr:MAG: ATP synthase F0 subunit B [Candidatus Uhrbacteria bacterium RIFCSPLOWO2_02_FULL_51_9]